MAGAFAFRRPAAAGRAAGRSVAVDEVRSSSILSSPSRNRHSSAAISTEERSSNHWTWRTIDANRTAHTADWPVGRAVTSLRRGLGRRPLHPPRSPARPHAGLDGWGGGRLTIGRAVSAVCSGCHRPPAPEWSAGSRDRLRPASQPSGPGRLQGESGDADSSELRYTRR